MSENRSEMDDKLGQVISGRKYWADRTPVAGQQFVYAFDDIGNRTSAKGGGDASGSNLRTSAYYPNALNQYWSNTVPGAVDVMGVALATNSVTVNGQAAYRKGEYFRKELAVNNTAAPVWQQITVAAPNEATVTRHEFVARTPQVFVHDDDGNLVADGRWTYTWDGENRLVAMAARTGIGPQISLKFEYDTQGRRIRKQVWGNAGWSGSATNDLRFVYDGWNLIAVLSPQSAVLRSFTWGLDLSGSLQGAGGVGGLLMVNDTANGVHFPAFDGNGNVAALVKSDGTLSAQYEYGPFGENLRATGLMAKSNPLRFSTKFQDDETGLFYYGYRYYSASTGRWLSKDPIEETGGVNLLAAFSNDPANRLDTLGLRCSKCICAILPETCTITVSWGSLMSDFYYLSSGKPPLVKPGARFLVKQEVTVVLSSYAGDVTGCHLHQATRGLASFPASPGGDGDWATPDDYGSAVKNRPYWGWWYWDAPTFDHTFGDRPASPQTLWWQAHVTVEESPKVETWYGFTATVDYNQKGSDPNDPTAVLYGFERWVGHREFFSVLPPNVIK